MKAEVENKILTAFSFFILFSVALAIIVCTSAFINTQDKIEQTNSHFELVGTSKDKSNYIESTSEYVVNIYKEKDTQDIWISVSNISGESSLLRTEYKSEDFGISTLEYTDCLIINGEYIYFKNNRELKEY